MSILGRHPREGGDPAFPKRDQSANLYSRLDWKDGRETLTKISNAMRFKRNTSLTPRFRCEAVTSVWSGW